MSNGKTGFGYTDSYGYSSDDPFHEPSQVPCTLGQYGPVQINNTQHMIGVRPRSGDHAGPRAIQLWAVVAGGHQGHPVDRVHWEVLGPVGSAPISTDGTRRSASACIGPPGMYTAAQSTGQLGQAVVDDPTDGLVAGCESGDWNLYEGTILLYPGQPCGDYRVELDAWAGYVESTLVSWIDVDCVLDIATNLSSIVWPTISPNSTVEALTGTGSTPEIVQTGNAPIEMSVAFSPLVHSGTVGGGTYGTSQLTSFGAALMRDGRQIGSIDPLAASEVGTFSAGGDWLVFDRPMFLHLYLHAPSSPEPGSYRGSMTLTFRVAERANGPP